MKLSPQWLAPLALATGVLLAGCEQESGETAREAVPREDQNPATNERALPEWEEQNPDEIGDGDP